MKLLEQTRLYFGGSTIRFALAIASPKISGRMIGPLLQWANCAKHSVQCFPGALYAFAALEAFSATALNSLPVQALAVDISEIVPAPAVANNAAMTDSASSPSVTIRKSLSPVVK